MITQKTISVSQDSGGLADITLSRIYTPVLHAATVKVARFADLLSDDKLLSSVVIKNAFMHEKTTVYWDGLVLKTKGGTVTYTVQFGVHNHIPMPVKAVWKDPNNKNKETVTPLQDWSHLKSHLYQFFLSHG